MLAISLSILEMISVQYDINIPILKILFFQSKIKHYSITENCIFIVQFQFVKSAELNILSGVPTGSILKALYFIFIFLKSSPTAFHFTPICVQAIKKFCLLSRLSRNIFVNSDFYNHKNDYRLFISKWTTKITQLLAIRIYKNRF